MNPMIGRPVLYYPAPDDAFAPNQGEALAGTIAWMDPTGRVTLSVLDQKGKPHAVQGVVLYHAGEELPPKTGRYAVCRDPQGLFNQPPRLPRPEGCDGQEASSEAGDEGEAKADAEREGGEEGEVLKTPGNRPRRHR